MTIIRTKTEAKGGVTPEEKIALAAHTKKWIGQIMRTETCDRAELTRAIEDLYEVSGLKKPRVVIVASPMMMAFAYGAARALLERQAAGEDVKFPDFFEPSAKAVAK